MWTDRAFVRRMKRFVDDHRGVAAVEFALVVPFLIVLYLGTVEASFSVAVHKKMEEAGATVGDLIARETDIDKEKLKAIMRIADSTMYPYPVENLELTIIGVENPEQGKIRLRWIESRSGKINLKYDDAIPMEDLDKLEGNFFVVVQSTYKYTPLSGIVDAAYEMQGLAISRVRLAKDLPCKNCTMTWGNQ